VRLQLPTFESAGFTFTLIPKWGCDKKIVKTIWYLHSKEVDAFILKIKVGVMCSCTTKLHENLDILIPMDL
jgi:hypothetical protein